MKQTLSSVIPKTDAVPVVPALAGVLAALVGVASFAAWASTLQFPSGPLSYAIFFPKPDVALAIFLSGFSLWLSAMAAGPSRARRVAQGLALATVLLALLAITGHAFDRDWGIRQLLLPSLSGVSSTPHSLRVALTTAINIVLLGLALSFPEVETRRGHRPAQYLAAIGGLFATQALIGYAYGASPSQSGAGFVQMPPLAAMAFFALSVGVLFLRPDRRPMAVLVNDRPSGVLARRLMWAAVLIPFVLGWLSLIGERAGWFGSTISTSLMVGATIAVFVFLIWQNAGLLHRLDEERRRAEERFAKVFRASPEGLIVIRGRDRVILEVNEGWERLTGYGRQEAIGKSSLDLAGFLRPEARESFYTRLDEEGSLRDFEMEIRRKAGEVRRVCLSADQVEIGGEPCTLAIVRDVTERRQAEKRLRESEALLRALVSSLDELVIESDAEGTYLNIWTTSEHLLVRPREELIGRRVGEVLGEEFTRPWLDIFRRVLATGQAESLEYTIDLADGTHWFLARINPIPAPDGTYRSVSTLARDITERKQAEEALRNSEARLKALIESCDDTIWSIDREYRLTMANSPFVKALAGLIGRELRLGESVLVESLPQALRDEWRGWYDRALEGEPFHFETHSHTAYGGAQYREHTFYPIPGPGGRVVGASCSSRDITARKRVEAALRESEARFRSIVETTREWIWEIDPAGRMLYSNPALEEILGYRPEEMIGARALTFMHEDDRRRIERAWPGLAAEKRGWAGLVLRWRHKDGTYRWLESTAVPVLSDAGELIGYRGTDHDITEINRSQAALAAEKERLAVTLRSIGDGVIATGTDGQVTLMNPVAERLTGWTQAEALGRPIADVLRLVHEKTHERIDDPVTQVLTTGNAIALANHTAVIARDGRERLIADSGAPIRDEDGRMLGAVLVIVDVTEKRKIEEELAKASKLESIGVLAGGIAHDFNNLLTAMLANVSLAKMLIASPERAAQRLAEMERACLRAKDLTQRLLTFAKGGAPVRKPTALGPLVKDAVGLALTGSNVQAAFYFPDDLWPAEVDAGQIGQAIQNMTLNATEAMPKGGVVQVIAENFHLRDSTGLPLAEGPYVKLIIADVGSGIRGELLDRIFDPFFSTKPGGQGLGLATVYSILQQHAGHVTAESAPGAGATFTVYLPAVWARAAAGESGRPRPAPHGSRVLVMDDEPAMRTAVEAVLSSLGYETGLAEDGRAAVELYRRAMDAGRPFDAVILDLTVPGGMGGLEALQELLAVDPGVRAIVSSGYSNDPIMTEFHRHGFRGAVVKPYSMGELSEVVEGVVSG